jgi:hypothetical protein
MTLVFFIRIRDDEDIVPYTLAFFIRIRDDEGIVPYTLALLSLTFNSQLSTFNFKKPLSTLFYSHIPRSVLDQSVF